MTWFILFIIAVLIVLVQLYYIQKLSIVTKKIVKLAWYQYEILKMINIEGYSYGDEAYEALQRAFKKADAESWAKAYGEFLICYKEFIND